MNSKYVDDFVQKFLNDSLQRTKKKFLPESTISHLGSDMEEERIHEESCKVLRKTTIPNDWTYLQNEVGFLPGVIPEDKPMISTQSLGFLNSPKEQNKKPTLNIGNKWNNGNKNNRTQSNAQAKNDKVAKRCVEHPKKTKTRSPLKNRDIGSPPSNGKSSI